MRLLILSLLMALCPPCIAFASDWVFEQDKQKHLIAGSIVGFLGSSITHLGPAPPKRWQRGLLTGVGVAIVACGKEGKDAGVPGNHFDWADVGYTIAGGALGFTVAEWLLPNPDIIIAPTTNGVVVRGRF